MSLRVRFVAIVSDRFTFDRRCILNYWCLRCLRSLAWPLSRRNMGHVPSSVAALLVRPINTHIFACKSR